MNKWQSMRWLLLTLVLVVLVIVACDDGGNTQAETEISTPALIFASPTPSSAEAGGASNTTPDMVVVVVTPTPGNAEEAGAAEAAEGENTADTAQTPAATGAITATTPTTNTQNEGTGAAPPPAADATPASVEMTEEELISTGKQVYATNCASCHQLNGEGSSTYPALNNNQFVNSEDPTAVITTILHGRGQMPAFEDNLSTQQIAAVASYIRNAWDNSTATVMVGAVRQIKGGGATASTTGAMTTTATMTATEPMTPTEAMTVTGQTTATTETSPETTPAADAEAAQPAVTATPMSDEQLISTGEAVYARNCASCHQLNGEGTSSYPALNHNELVTNEEPRAAIEVVLHGRGQMPAFADTLSNQEIAAVLSYVRNNWDNSAAVVPVAQVRQVAQDGNVAGGASSESAQASAPMTATAAMTATQSMTTTPEAAQAAAPAATPTPAAEAVETTQTPTAEDDPAASATLTTTTTAGAAPVVEPPEIDSMTTMDEAAEEATPVSPEALISRGEELYTMNCAACHQAEGQGIDGVYPRLAGNAFVTTEDPTPAITVVVTGRAGMPRFGSDLSAHEIAAILSYVRNSWSNEASTVTPEQVRAVREAVAGSEETGGH